MEHNYDVTIIGAGIVGASLACLLAQQELDIALIESHPLSVVLPREGYALRVSALNQGTEKILREIGVWEAIMNFRVGPYKHMTVWDAKGKGKIEFDCKEIGENYLGHIVENNIILNALHNKIQQSKNITFYCPESPQTIIKQKEHIVVELNDKSICSQLLVGADGAHSWVREKLGITLKEKSYHQVAFVTTVKTEKAHDYTAWQCFLPEGPIALLPLDDPHYCSMVWSMDLERAKQVRDRQEEEFNEAVTCIFKDYLGDIVKVDKLVEFPLYERHVENYIQDRVALVGDAAHTIHPLAGQGLNLGFQDVACLTKIIQEAALKNRDWSQNYVLRKYERERKSENYNMIVAMCGLKELFGSSQSWLEKLRSIGLNKINNSGFIKRMLMRYAVGK